MVEVEASSVLVSVVLAYPVPSSWAVEASVEASVVVVSDPAIRPLIP